MEKMKFENPKKPDDYEINDRDLPLREIPPDKDEKSKYDINIINGILKDFDKQKNKIEKKRREKDKNKKPN